MLFQNQEQLKQHLLLLHLVEFIHFVKPGIPSLKLYILDNPHIPKHHIHMLENSSIPKHYISMLENPSNPKRHIRMLENPSIPSLEFILSQNPRISELRIYILAKSKHSHSEYTFWNSKHSKIKIYILEIQAFQLEDVHSDNPSIPILERSFWKSKSIPSSEHAF
jgi:hypothetical protein